MGRPYVFVSHIHEEAPLAEIFQRHISRDFLGMVDVFVSSDTHSIAPGSKFLNEIDNALKKAKVELLLCSEESVQRPWINFEAGAGWVKGIPLIPVCHTGYLPIDLPVPLSTLQAVETRSVNDLKKLYTLLAEKLGSDRPSLGKIRQLCQEVKKFETDYGRHLSVASGVPHQLHHVSLPVGDLQRAVDFYRLLLDRDPLPQAPSRLERPPLPDERPDFRFGGAWFVLPSGQHLHLVVNPKGTFRKSKRIQPRDSHFALRVSDFNCAKARLIEMKRKFLPDPLGMGYQQLYFLDEDLHVVEINADL